MRFEGVKLMSKILITSLQFDQLSVPLVARFFLVHTCLRVTMLERIPLMHDSRMLLGRC